MIAIIGNGYVAQVLKANWGTDALIVEGRFSTFGELRKALTAISPTMVVNAAHKGSPASMEKLEEYSADWNEHVLVNVQLPQWIALLAGELDFAFVHLSTMMVLRDWPMEYDPHDPDGRGYDELKSSYATYPEISNYAKLKRMAEYALLGDSLQVAHDPARVTVVRIHLPFSKLNHPRNILLRYREFGRLATDKVSMTNLDDLAAQLVLTVAHSGGKVLHVVGTGVASAYDIGVLMYQKGFRETPPLPTTIEAINATRTGAFQPRIVAHSWYLDFVNLRPAELVPDLEAAIDHLMENM